MTLQTVPPLVWPLDIHTRTQSATFATSAIAIDGASDRVAVITQAQRAGTISAVHFVTATVTTGCTISVRLETVTNGRPSGTLLATDTSGTVVVADGDDNTYKTVTLTAGATVTKGQEFAVLFSVSSGTPNMNMVRANTAATTPGVTYPLVLHDTGTGSWSGLQADLLGAIEYSTDGPVWTPGFMPLSGGASIATYGSGSSPDEKALKFSLPFKCRVRGVLASLANISAGADYKVFLWDAAGDTEAEALATCSMDGDSTIGTTSDGPMMLAFVESPTIKPGTYYLGVRAETANALALVILPVIALSNAMQAMPWGANCYLSTRTWSAINPGTVGAWSDTTTQVPLVSLVIDQLDDGLGEGRATYVLGV